MDFVYSPHREPGGTMHLPSPTHPHSYRMDGAHFSSIQQLRRSLSRSPSKPSRFHLRKSDSPGSPISPLALARAFSPRQYKDPSAPTPSSESPLSHTPATTKKKFTLRRSAPFRSSPRNRPNSKSPRRVLADSTDQGNQTPFSTKRASGEENVAVRSISQEYLDKMGADQNPVARFDIDDKPIKFEFARSRKDDSSAPGANCMIPIKSSPLKRSDGVMNLDSTSMGSGRSGSPMAKRRSLHGASSFGSDFDVFEHGPTSRSSIEEQRRAQDGEINSGYSFSSPVSGAHTPLRKAASLRKSTLSQRQFTNTSRPKPMYDGEFALPMEAASKSRNRMSLDSSLGHSSGTTQSPFRKSGNFEPPRPAHQPFFRGSAGNSQPHPLSNALSQSPSLTSMTGDAPGFVVPALPAPAPPATVSRHHFSRSLPIGTTRPQPDEMQESSDGLYATPAAYRMAKPNPAAFMSTGLLSKKNRNVEDPSGGTYGTYVMPDTPSKRMSFPPALTETPLVKRSSIFRKPSQSFHEFGTPSTPFSAHASKTSTESFGKGVNIFGSFGSNHQRRSSFASIDGEDISYSPTGNRMIDSQSSADEMPPTPTKQNDGSGRRSKESSLRRKTFRQRTSLGNDTFAAPETPSINIPLGLGVQNAFDASSPRTPNESIYPPDPSNLSISGPRRGSLLFADSTHNNNSFPPATPTTPRDSSSYFANAKPIVLAGLTKNDIDTSLTSRFESVEKMEKGGEFSFVFKVKNPVAACPSFTSTSPPAASQVWVVKKTKKPYFGAADRAKKIREVDILQALRGNGHIVSLISHWEFDQHLYMQMEYCESGDLFHFLAKEGNSSRLDDFRIWKIMLEMASGVKHIHDNGFIHLDLKPANIFIDFGGALKIGDFGLASSWPAPPHIDAEGDRHYLAPEVLNGRPDKPSDVYALGAIMLEIGSNSELPENGVSWRQLRSGDFSGMPSLTWSSESALDRDAEGHPITDPQTMDASAQTDGVSFLPTWQQEQLAKAPRFMMDPTDDNSLNRMVEWMMAENPVLRPVIDQVLACGGCQWVDSRSRAAATIFEGNFGPDDDVLTFGHHDVEMADMMDTS